MIITAAQILRYVLLGASSRSEATNIGKTTQQEHINQMERPR